MIQNKGCHSFGTGMEFLVILHALDACVTCGFWRNSAMSMIQDGHFITFFCTLNDLLPWPLCLVKLWPAKAASRHALQKLCAHGVVIGQTITFRQIWQLNSAWWTTQKQEKLPLIHWYWSQIMVKRHSMETRGNQRLHVGFDTVPFKSFSLTDTFCLCRLIVLITLPSSGSPPSATLFLLTGGGFFHIQQLFSSWKANVYIL